MKAKPTYKSIVTPATPIWPEYAGVSQHNHGSYVYSEAAHQARVSAMDVLFRRATAILDRNYRPEGT